MSIDKRQTDLLHLTDMGNGERFVREQGKNARYVFPWERWLVWDGQRWKIDDSGAVRRLAKKTVQSIYHEAAFADSEGERKAISKWGQHSEKSERVSAMLKMAQSELPIGVDELDSHPWKLNCSNGTLDLDTCELRVHDRRDFLTKVAPVEFPQEEVDCPLWMAFLNRIFDSDRELIPFVKRILALSLVGEVFEHVLPIFYGSGANGKSVLIETWLRVLGPDYGINAPPDLLIAKRADAHPTERADLHGKRFVAAVESGEGRQLNESLVKELTGGDRIRARHMKEDFWEFRPSHLPVMVTNHKPVVRGTDQGIWRRLKLVPFRVTIPDAEQDSELVDKLQTEAGHILRWALGGIIEWRQLGLHESEVVKVATDGYRQSQDVLQAFLSDRCVEHVNAKTSSKSLYAAYSAWCKQSGEEPTNQRQFGTAMTERGFERRKVNGRVQYMKIGIASEDIQVDLGMIVDPFPSSLVRENTDSAQ